MKNFLRLFCVLVMLLFPMIDFVRAESDIQDAPGVDPNEEVLEGIVLFVSEEGMRTIEGVDQFYQKLEFGITKGSLKGQRVIIENGAFQLAQTQKYKEGDRLVVMKGVKPDGENGFFIVDYMRRGSIWWLLAIFLTCVVLIGRWKGISSIMGMIITFFVIFSYVLPSLNAGSNPVFTVLIASIAIIPATFYLSHGVNKKTTIAMAGTFLAFLITGILAALFVQSAHLTGFASEEAIFLQVAKSGTLNLREILLAGIIIGTLGILDDITVSQAAIVEQLRAAKETITFRELYSRAMAIGRDHIASMVNTLILVYTGAALPLLLLFLDNSTTYLQIMNYEQVAAEIVRMLVGSIGLILAVPITTMIAATAYQKAKIEHE